ncbi:hypothetical protein GPK27_00060 [Catenibacterium mitsuokai]|uniref:sigma factor-like helix-turn-helix DNA-binding protein n=1 Tax=Coprobacillaceae TaxID=2810280 RepID=UPI00192BAABB|nr:MULTISPECIES: sigma factor-like helix-turn-helix DNA-binding protein [Coprobacillaceae]MBT9813855.1 hypothetical protein [Catenibacterium mitsuokai]MCR1948734.1 hypothetical protein [Thomasclavelia ramosa]QQY26143.1 hypothetical protein I6I63_08540 [Thomasclavelia ramosa]
MKNDYEKSNFWIKEIDGKKIYYIRLKDEFIEVSQDVFSVCRNSYQKMYYEIKKDERVDYYSDINQMHLLNCIYDFDYTKYLFIKELIRKVKISIQFLTTDEQFIISQLYFNELTEKELATQLGISQQRLHYQKKKILNKLKKILLSQI